MKRTIQSLALPALVAILALTRPMTAYGTVSSIGSNFNGTNIADTSFLWFNSHLTSVSGNVGPVTIYLQNQTISFTSPATSILYTLSVPDAQVIIDSSFGSASTVFNTGTSTWVTSVPDDSSNPFLAGLVWDVPTGENPKASNPVTWSGNFLASQSGVSIAWQWSAAVYTTLSTDLTTLGVTPIDGQGASQSGTPLNFTDFVTGGARGGGGSNFTGSNSGTASVDLTVVPEPGSTLLVSVAGVMALLRRRRPGQA